MGSRLARGIVSGFWRSWDSDRCTEAVAAAHRARRRMLMLSFMVVWMLLFDIGAEESQVGCWKYFMQLCEVRYGMVVRTHG